MSVGPPTWPSTLIKPTPRFFMQSKRIGFPCAPLTGKQLLITWGVLFLVGLILAIFFPVMDERFPTPAYLLQLHYYQTKLQEWYEMNFGIREVWVMHAPNRYDLTETMKKHYEKALLPHHVAASFDSGTLSNHTMANQVSRIFVDDNKWLLEDHLNDLQPGPLADIYGGWQSHIYCWERVVAYKINSRLEMPVLVIEDDAILNTHFLSTVKILYDRLPDDWRILSLDKEGIKCKPDYNGFCKLDHMHLGNAYIIRNSATANELYKRNNLKAPPLVTDSQGNPIGWKPNVPQDWSWYVLMNDKLVRKGKFPTKYPHHPGFTPP